MLGVRYKNSAGRGTDITNQTMECRNPIPRIEESGGLSSLRHSIQTDRGSEGLTLTDTTYTSHHIDIALRPWWNLDGVGGEPLPIDNPHVPLVLLPFPTYYFFHFVSCG